MVRRAALVAVLLLGCQHAGRRDIAPAALQGIAKGLDALEHAAPEQRARFFQQTIWESGLLVPACGRAVEHAASVAPADRARAVSEAARVCHFSLPDDPQARPDDVVTAFLVETSTRALAADPAPRAHELAARIGALAPTLTVH